MTGKQLKNSILQWAIQGKLVPQDPNDEPASVLLERIRQEKERLIKEKKIKRDKNASIIYRGEDNSYYEKFLATGEVKCIDEEIPFEIPQGWEWCRVRDVSQSYIGLTYSPSDVSSDGVIVLRSSNIQNGKISLNDIVRVKTSISEKLQVEKNDIIICARNGSKKLVGKSAVVEEVSEPMTFGAFMAICKTHLYRYVYIFLQSDLFFSQLRNVSGTTTINQLTQNNFNGFLIPIPPEKEQKKISDRLSDILPIVDKYGNLQCKLDNLNTLINELLRKSILQEAIQGKLVPQKAEEGTAQDLLEQIKLEKQNLIKEGKLKKSALTDSVIFKGDDNKYWEKKGKNEKDITDEIPFEIPDSWAWVRLSSISDITGGYAFQSSSLKEVLGKRVIRISDISEQGFVNTKIVRYNGTPISDIYRIQKFDIIMAMTGGTVGKSLFVRELPEDELLLNQRVARIRNLWISVDYLNFVIIAPHIKEFISKQKNSTNDNISMADISNFLIPLPPIKEQLRIVEKLYNLASIMRG